MEINRSVARVFKPLLQPARYKGAYGGRGSGKSHFFAEQLVSDHLCTPGLRSVCLREIQRTLDQSVKRLIEDKIGALGVSSYFECQDRLIKAPGGGVIIFEGMQSHNADSIKSLEGFRRAYWEEAQTASQRSLDLLRPTLRAEGSEIWFAWNPRHDTDPVDVFLRQQGRKDAIVVEANWKHNPWLPNVLRAEVESDYEADPEKALHIWGGGYEVISEGSYYGRLIAEAERQGRVGDFPHDPERRVFTAWDLGVDDYTAIVFAQTDGRRVRIIDYHEASGDGAQVIVAEAFGDKPYRFERHFLPHDVKVREWGAGAKTRYETLRSLGVNPIEVGGRLGPDERIAASRVLLPQCEFDDNPRVQLLLRRLRAYRRKWSEPLQSYQGVLHDEASHGSDAFGELALHLRVAAPLQEKPKPPRDRYARRNEGVENSWMTV